MSLTVFTYVLCSPLSSVFRVTNVAAASQLAQCDSFVAIEFVSLGLGQVDGIERAGKGSRHWHSLRLGMRERLPL